MDKKENLAVFLCCCLFLIITSCASTKGPAGNQYDYSNGWYHRVAKGESLWVIAKRYGRDVNVLAYLNDISNPDKIHPGDYIYIPPYDVRLPETHINQLKARGATSRQVSSAQSPQSDKPDMTRSKKPSNTSAALTSNSKSKPKSSPRIATEFSWPVNGRITRRFNLQDKDTHKGLDIAAPAGTRIRASRSGTVVYSGREIAGYGNLVIIDHGDGYATVYAHNEKNVVKTNQQVKQGQVIALIGATGHSTGNHLHFEIRHNAKPVDPLKYLTKK